MFKNVKENVPSNPSLKFVHKFWLKALNIKQILVDEFLIDLTTLFSPKFFIFFILLCLNKVWNSTSNTIPALGLTMIMSGSRAPTNLHIPHGLLHLLPPHMFIMNLLSSIVNTIYEWLWKKSQ